MIYTLTFSELVASMFSALMLIASLYSMGRLILAKLRWRQIGADAALVTGMAANHLIFLLLAICFEGQTTIMLMHGIHISAVALSLMRYPHWFQRRMSWRLNPAIILGLLYLPYMFSPLSPPMNYDAMFAYVANAEWVYYHGLEFNPASTAYATMPMGAEYLFAQAFPIGGKLSIYLFDALFGALLIRRMYTIASTYLSDRASILLVLLFLLIPEGIPFMLGIAKVDTINLYLIISGFGWLMDRSNPHRYWYVLLAFSMACAVKYTGWLQLLLPVVVTVIVLLRQKGWSKGLFAALLPMLFITPVLLKNLVQTGNPLVGLSWSPSQQAYVEQHVGMKKTDLSREISGHVEQRLDPVKTTIQLSYNYLNFVLYALLAIFLLVALAVRAEVKDLWWSVGLLLAVLVPWHLFVGSTLQPPRFLLAFYFVIFLLCFILGKRILQCRGIATAGLLRYAFMLAFSISFFNTYYRHSNRIPKFLQAQRMPLHQWYEQSGNYVFSITTRLRDEGWLGRRIMFMSPAAKGLLSADQLTGDHTDSSRRAFRHDFGRMRKRFDYVLCNETDILKYGLRDRPVMLQSGYMYLLKLH